MSMFIKGFKDTLAKGQGRVGIYRSNAMPSSALERPGVLAAIMDCFIARAPTKAAANPSNLSHAYPSNLSHAYIRWTKGDNSRPELRVGGDVDGRHSSKSAKPSRDYICQGGTGTADVQGAIGAAIAELLNIYPAVVQIRALMVASGNGDVAISDEIDAMTAWSRVWQSFIAKENCAASFIQVIEQALKDNPKNTNLDRCLAQLKSTLKRSPRVLLGDQYSTFVDELSSVFSSQEIFDGLFILAGIDISQIQVYGLNVREKYSELIEALDERQLGRLIEVVNHQYPGAGNGKFELAAQRLASQCDQSIVDSWVLTDDYRLANTLAVIFNDPIEGDLILREIMPAVQWSNFCKSINRSGGLTVKWMRIINSLRTCGLSVLALAEAALKRFPKSRGLLNYVAKNRVGQADVPPPAIAVDGRIISGVNVSAIINTFSVLFQDGPRSKALLRTLSGDSAVDISMEGASIDRWTRIVRHLVENNIPIGSLVAVALAHYPGNRDLKKFAAELGVSVRN